MFDSSGPDLRIRGTAQQLFEKYLQLGRDASSSGDRVMAESYFQHAEHYFRILNAMAQAAQNQNGERPQGGPPQNGHPNGGGTSREGNAREFRRATMEAEGPPPDDDQPDPLVPPNEPSPAPDRSEQHDG